MQGNAVLFDDDDIYKEDINDELVVYHHWLIKCVLFHFSSIHWISNMVILICMHSVCIYLMNIIYFILISEDFAF